MSIYDLPTAAELTALGSGPIISNSVASREQITAIDTDAQAHLLNNYTPAQRRDAYISLAVACAHIGSSDRVVVPGSIAPALADGPAGPTRNALAALIRRTCTLRQFCMFWAKFVWNILLSTNTPPALWSSKGFAFRNRFVAFDFFDGVNHPSAIDPADDLVRAPTHEELVAHQASRAVNIHRDRLERPAESSTYVEFTGGRPSGARPVLSLPSANNPS
jgi:hypothetical protein